MHKHNNENTKVIATAGKFKRPEMNQMVQVRCDSEFLSKFDAVVAKKRKTRAQLVRDLMASLIENERKSA